MTSFTQQREIREAVEAGTGPYKDLTSSQRSELLTKQERMLHTIDGKKSTDELNEQQKTEVFNTLESIEAVVNNTADDERMVCERRPILGSNRKERVCKPPVAVEGQEREAARGVMDSGSICADCRNE